MPTLIEGVGKLKSFEPTKVSKMVQQIIFMNFVDQFMIFKRWTYLFDLLPIQVPFQLMHVCHLRSRLTQFTSQSSLFFVCYKLKSLS